ncbi:MAG: ABC transporter substrate-binding protein [Candidatus Thiodiazotropha sp.]|jgi:phospholipid transport system substrate-binding protein
MIRFTALLLFGLMFISSLPAAATITPSDRVRQTVDSVLEVLQNPGLGSIERRDQVREIVRQRFDYESMSQVILATNWRSATPPQREQFITLFRELLEQTYFSAMDSYDNQKVRMGRERQKGKLAEVQTFVTSASKEVPVSYKLRLRNDDWYAYDVSVDGVSLVSNYRTSFRNLVKQRGMDGLLAELANKVATLKTKSRPPQQPE